jgi:predicted homoserine dehydrogenase-like protein
MHGPAGDLAGLLDVYRGFGLLDGGRYVDYLLGARGVFVVIESDDPCVREDFQYLKLGDGPHYVLHRPEVLVHYAAPLSIERAVRRGEATVTPLGVPVADTIAYAKRDLAVGQRLDGIGGFDTYGLIVRANEVRRDALLPIGLAQYARICRPVRKDDPITDADIVFEVDNLALQLRRKQDQLLISHQTELPR